MDKLEQLHAELNRTYGSHFVAYHRAHIAHINIRGRSFYQDHKLLQKIYEYLQDNVDVLGEKIQACGLGAIPDSIGDTIGYSDVIDSPVSGTAEDLLHTVWEDLNTMIEVYHGLGQAARDCNYPDVDNMAADHIGALAAFAWKIEATLEIPGRHHERTGY